MKWLLDILGVSDFLDERRFSDPKQKAIVKDVRKKLKLNSERSMAYSAGLISKYVDLVPGSLVACDLYGGIADHTGIYIGRNRIVELNGDGFYKKVSIHDFLNSSMHRTGVSLFVACSGGKVISNSSFSKRAKAFVGSKTDYQLIFNNCHIFSAYCIFGEKKEITTFTALCDLVAEEYDNLEWCPVRNV